MNRLFCWALAASAACCPMSGANAATISHTWDFTTQPSNGYHSGFVLETYVPRFEASLGTLERVDLSVLADVDLTLTWSDASHPTFEVLGQWRNTGDFDATALVEPAAPPYGISTLPLGEFQIYMHPAGYSGSLSGSGHYSADGTTGEISDPDQSIWVTADHVRLYYREEFYGLWDSGNSVAFSVTGSAVHRMTLSYIYAPSVPEPETWGIMLLGFAVAGVRLRSRMSFSQHRVAQ